jgi:CBS domain-containing protein
MDPDDAAPPPVPAFDPDRPVHEVMHTAFRLIEEGETVLVAWELMERTGYHHLAVVRPDGRCRGVLERGDLAVHCAAPASRLSGLRIADLPRSRRTVRVHPDTSIADAARAMCRSDSDAVPVTGTDGRAIGLVTARDLVSALAGQTRRGHAASAGPLMGGLPPRQVEHDTEMP